MTTSARTYHHGNLREALLTAAESALASGGDLSLRALARQVGVSHAAPRRHFSDKQALLAGGLAAAMLGALVLIGGAGDTRAIWAGGGWFAQLALVGGVWLLVGPAWTAAARYVPSPVVRTHKERIR